MIEKTIEKIESSIRKMGGLDNQRKDELIRLLSELKSEVGELSRKNSEHAESIAGFVEVAAHEATRKNKSAKLQEVSLEGLASSVRGFEASHPRLVEAVNRICSLLSGIGI